MKIEKITETDTKKVLTKHNKYATLSESAGNAADFLRVTKISQGIKNPNRANIFINDKFEFSLNIAQLSDTKLKVGQQLSQSELDSLKQASDFGKLYQRTLEWVLARPRSVQETRDYLRRKQFEKASAQSLPIALQEHQVSPVKNTTITGESEGRVSKCPRGRILWDPPEANQNDRGVFDKCEQTCDPAKLSAEILGKPSSNDEQTCNPAKLSAEIIDKLISKGYLNDAKFAEFWVENRSTKKGISRRRLEQELIKKGIAKSIIHDVLASTDRTDSAEITKIITKKRTKYASDPQKLIQYLVRQGFDYESAKTAVLETDSQNLA